MFSMAKLKAAVGRKPEVSRNELMVNDVRAFAQQLKAFRAEFNTLSKAVVGGLNVVKTVLGAPLPKAYDQGPSGVAPSDPETHLIGLTVVPEGIINAGVELQQRLQQNVMAPLEQWLDEYRATKAEHTHAEKIRASMNAQRDVAASTQEKYQKQMQNNHKDAPSTGARLQTEQDKLARLIQEYDAKEAQVFNALVRLVRDSASLKDFIAASLVILQCGFTEAHAAFEKAPPPPQIVLPNPASAPVPGAVPVISPSHGGPGEPGSAPWTNNNNPPPYHASDPGNPYGAPANPYSASSHPDAGNPYHTPDASNPYGAPGPYAGTSGEHPPGGAPPVYGSAASSYSSAQPNPSSYSSGQPNPYGAPPAYPDKPYGAP